MLLFQNCELAELKKNKMVLPNDISVIEPYHNTFSETTSIQKMYRVSFDLEARQVDARMVDGNVTGALEECNFNFDLSAEQVQELKLLLGRIELCDDPAAESRVCAGSCPYDAYNFYSNTFLKSGAPVENGWLRVSKNENDISSRIYFCGGQDKLFGYLKARVEENLPEQCPKDFPILF